MTILYSMHVGVRRVLRNVMEEGYCIMWTELDSGQWRIIDHRWLLINQLPTVIPTTTGAHGYKRDNKSKLQMLLTLFVDAHVNMTDSRVNQSARRWAGLV